MTDRNFTKSDLSNYISHLTNPYGKGYGFDYYLNGDYVSKQKFLENAQNGDTIEVRIYTSRGKYYTSSAKETLLINDEFFEKVEQERNNRIPDRGKRDYQKSKAYSWERENVEGHHKGEEMTEEEMQEFVSSVINDLDVPTRCNVKLHKGRNRSSQYFGYESPPEIRFGPWGMNKVVALHELAHHIFYEIGLKNRKPDHGPQFIKIFIDLLDEYTENEKEDLIENSDTQELDVDESFEWKDLLELSDDKKRSKVACERTTE